MKRIDLLKFNPADDMGNDWHINENPVMSEYTLCGLAFDGGADNRDICTRAEKTGTLSDVTCQSCLSVVEFCQSLGRIKK